MRGNELEAAKGTCILVVRRLEDLLKGQEGIAAANGVFLHISYVIVRGCVPRGKARI